MPVIVVGADTEVGESILEALHQPEREIRVFISDPSAVESHRRRGYKVALGDVSDDSHVEAAAMRCFSAVLIGEAATDERERSFAADPDQVWKGWAQAVGNSEVTRAIWVGVDSPPDTTCPEVAVVSADSEDVATRVAALDEAHSIT